MQPKAILFLATLLATAAAVPATPPTANNNAAAVPMARDNNEATHNNGDASTKAVYSWQAKGGCKTDWSGRCNSQCVGEAAKENWACKNIDSDITSSGCVVGWNTCECTCFY